jgi:2-ketocyclohexanecarboxyl-CoA hydrolase
MHINIPDSKMRVFVTSNSETSIYKDILYGKHGGVARITINRPAQLNAFTGSTLEELSAAFEDAAGDREVGVVVLTGTGDRAFCAGGDINWEAAGGLERHDWHLGRRIVDLPKPVIARVSGYAIGAGNHLAYFCDFTIAADHSIFGQNGPRVGSPAGGYVVSHAASVIGHKRAREMWMLCRRYTAQQALEWGLINSVVPLNDLDLEVARWCEELLSLSPSVLRTVKASFRAHMESYMGRNVSDMVQEFAPDIFTSGEQQEGAAAFLEKRPPNFSRWR